MLPPTPSSTSGGGVSSELGELGELEARAIDASGMRAELLKAGHERDVANAQVADLQKKLASLQSVDAVAALQRKEEELDVTFEVVDEIREEDRTPEVLAALSATFSQFPSGASF